MTRISNAVLIILVPFIAGAVGGFYFGHDAGATNCSATRDAAAVKQLGEIISAHTALVDEADKASKALRVATSQRAALDNKTNKELKDALAKTAGTRAGCQFDDNSMRQLEAARARANQAAAIGIIGAVPAAP